MALSPFLSPFRAKGLRSRLASPTLIVSLLLTAACGSEEEDSCVADNECELPATCSERQRCELPEPAEQGASCKHDAHCRSKTCLDLGEGGVCSLNCEDATDCEPDQQCLPAATRPVGGGDQTLKLTCRDPAQDASRYLAEACTEDAQCRSGLCHDQRCSQPCGQCPALMSCERQDIERNKLTLNTGLCLPEALIHTIELGAVDTPATGAAPVKLDISMGVTSVILFAEAADNLGVMIRRVTDPDGAVLLDMEAETPALMRASWPYNGTGTALLPGTGNPRAALKQGTYQIWVATYDVTAFRERHELARMNGRVSRVAAIVANRARSGGLLDLQIHLAPATGLTAAEANNSDYVNVMLDRIRRIFRFPLGIDIGDVRFSDMGEDQDQIESGDAARAMVKQLSNSASTGPAVNIFLVSSLSFPRPGGGTDPAAAFSSVIPGVPGVVGRPASGIVARAQKSATDTGGTVAHEIGHFLGLWHTSEEGTELRDPLNDTPECAAALIDHDTNWTQCPDVGNAMFPFFNPRGGMSFSPQQQTVVRRTPWLYDIAYPDVCGSGILGVDVSSHGFASGLTAPEGSDTGTGELAGTCGGNSYGEAVHLYRLTQEVDELRIGVRGPGFNPAVHVRLDSCEQASTEIACQAGTEDQPVELTIKRPDPGAYYIIVDGADGQGRYELVVTTYTEPPPQ